MSTGHHLARCLAALACATLAACGDSTERELLDTISARFAFAQPPVARVFVPDADGGLVLAHDWALADHDASATRARTVFPARAADGLKVSVAGRDDAWLRVRPRTSADATRAIVDGLVVYPAMLGGADAIYVASPGRVEEYLHLHDAAEGEALVFDVELGAGITTLASDAYATGLEARDAAGRVLLRAPAPVGVDAAGRTVTGRLSARSDAGRWSIRVALTGDAPTYPVLLDPSWVGTGTMAYARYGHSATALANGKVLIAGGAATAQTELYDPSTGTFAPGPAMAGPRLFHTATVVGDGRVLFTGGFTGTSSEVYLPATNTFAPASPPSGSTTATYYPTYGYVVLTGNGCNRWLEDSDTTLPCGGSGAQGSFSTSTLIASRGYVFLFGGGATTLFENGGTYYNVTTPAPVARAYNTATLLPGDDVLIAGGFQSGTYPLGAYTYNVATGFTATAGPLGAGRIYHAATLLPSHKVLVTGGYNNTTLASAELYDPALRTFTATDPLATARYYHTATLLASGKVLVVGGRNQAGTPLASAELYTPAACEPHPEVCNGVDDDCDQITDNGLTDLGLACSTGRQGVCAAGTTACISGEPYCAQTTASGTEACDGDDDDCDGAIDDNVPGVGDVCATGLPGAYATGTTTCSGGTTSCQRISDLDVSAVLVAPTSTYAGEEASLTITVINHGTRSTAGDVRVLVTYDHAALSPTAFGDCVPQGADLACAVGDLAPGAETQRTGRLVAAVGARVPSVALTVTITSDVIDPTPGNNTRAATLALRFCGDGRFEVTREQCDDGGNGGGDGCSAACAFEAGFTEPDWVATGDTTHARSFHTATRLASGKVLISGGTTSLQTELYDPGSGTFAVGGSMAEPRVFHAATLLPDGRVLLQGSTPSELYLPSSDTLVPAGPATSAVTAAYDTAYRTVVSSGPGGCYRWKEDDGSTQLMDSNINGTSSVHFANRSLFFAYGGAETRLIDHATTPTHVDTPPGAVRSYPTATLISADDVLLVGGVGANGSYPRRAFVYNAYAGFRPVGELVTGRAFHTATLLPSGKVLITGGVSDDGTPLASAELYDPVLETFSETVPLGVARRGHSATLLSDGDVLVVGGTVASGAPTTNAERYTPLGCAAGAACATGLQGVCAAGTTVCVDDAPTCVQTTASSTEVCDEADNDCDGVVDEGFDADEDGIADCVDQCLGGSSQSCAPSPFYLTVRTPTGYGHIPCTYDGVTLACAQSGGVAVITPITEATSCE